MLTLLISLLLSLVVLVHIKQDYNAYTEPLVKPEQKPVQTLGVAYIMPTSPLTFIDKPIYHERREPELDKRAQYQIWKENVRSYEQIRLKLYTS